MAGQNVPNAFNDPTGAYAGTNQSGPVFFVAGSFSSGPTSRSFNVPAGKYLLVPLVNIEESEAEPLGSNPPPTSVADAQNYVNTIFNSIVPSSLELIINGAPFAGDLSKYAETYESTADLFELNWADPNFSYPDGSVTGPSGYSIAKGYWAMFAPLGDSQMTIVFGGSATATEFSPAFSLEVTDTITGVPEPWSMAVLATALVPLGLLTRRRGEQA